jgi:hypothetical protein
VTSFAPLICAPESTIAVVTSSTMLIAAPAPIPTVPAPVSFALALSVLSTHEVAVSETSDALSDVRASCST